MMLSMFRIGLSINKRMVVNDCGDLIFHRLLLRAGYDQTFRGGGDQIQQR